MELLRSVRDEYGIDADVLVSEVTGAEEARALQFPGSPTIRVNGRDIEAVGAAEQPASTCRIYRLEDGRVSPVPSREQLEDALR